MNVSKFATRLLADSVSLSALACAQNVVLGKAKCVETYYCVLTRVRRSYQLSACPVTVLKSEMKCVVMNHCDLTCVRLS